MSKHTPGPWRLEGWVDAGNGVAIRGADGGPVCRVDGATAWTGVAGVGFRTTKTRDANAAFIVQACNSHDELVEALRFARQFVVLAAEQGLNGALNTLEFVDAALAKARGEAK